MNGHMSELSDEQWQKLPSSCPNPKHRLGENLNWSGLFVAPLEVYRVDRRP